MQVPTRRGELNKVRDQGAFPITRQGLQRLQQELEECERKLPALIAEVMRTKENGDLSENFEYQDAKHTLRRMHSRIATMKDRIARAAVIERHSAKSGMVELGSSVVLESDGKRMTYEILGSHESDPSRGRISDRSPLGVLLLGRMVGDRVTLTTKTSSRDYTILEIR